MKKILILSLLTLTALTKGIAADAPTVFETQASFSPSTKRDSLFFLPTITKKDDFTNTDISTMGIGEMIARYIKPKGIIMGKTDDTNRIFIGSRFFGKGDIIVLEAPANKDVRYEKNPIELTVNRVGATSIELVDNQKREANRVSFSFSPNTRSTLKDATDDGAKVRFVGHAKDVVNFETP